MHPLVSMQDTAAWFHVLNEEQQQHVLQDITITTYPEGAMIERKGERACAWLGILSGLVKISVGTAEGKMAS